MKYLNITTDEAQGLRKDGNWIISNKRYTKVIMITKDKGKAEAKYRQIYDQSKRHDVNIWSPLRKVYTTQADIDRADKMYALSLNCPMSELYKGGEVKWEY